MIDKTAVLSLYELHNTLQYESIGKC